MKPSQYLMRVPEKEREAIAAIFSAFPGVSPALLMRAVLLASPRIWIRNAIAKHAAGGREHED